MTAINKTNTMTFATNVLTRRLNGGPYTGWPHSSRNEIPCVFPEFSLCYTNFLCVIFTQKLTISSKNKGHISTILLHTEAYKLIFLKCG